MLDNLLATMRHRYADELRCGPDDIAADHLIAFLQREVQETVDDTDTPLAMASQACRTLERVIADIHALQHSIRQWGQAHSAPTDSLAFELAGLPPTLADALTHALAENESLLDELVHDAHSDEAATINNSGGPAQVAYLVTALGLQDTIDLLENLVDVS